MSLIQLDSPERFAADLFHLATMVDDQQPGWTRRALTDVDAAGRHWVAAQMRAAGLQTHIDGAGNVVGRLPGSGGEGPALMTGSHTDTVAGGGRFDGNVGVAAALEVVRTLRATDTVLRHDLIVVDFFSEEPNRFGVSCVGSRAMMGELYPAHLDRTDAQGQSFGEALRGAKIDPAAALSARIDPRGILAFIELHIEQGPHLEEQGSSIGLVTSITGIRRFHAVFEGRRDHAGTTPMDRRHDAGCAAAGSVLAVEQIASSHPDGRGTTGLVTFTPEAINVVTERAEMWGEFRSPDGRWLMDAATQFEREARRNGELRGVELEMEWLPSEEPARMTPALLGIASRVVDSLGLRQSRLYSGAEHDAAVIAKHIPTTMLFVPSHDGRSHCPEEFTAHGDLVDGATALLNTLLAIDSGS